MPQRRIEDLWVHHARLHPVHQEVDLPTGSTARGVGWTEDCIIPQLQIEARTHASHPVYHSTVNRVVDLMVGDTSKATWQQTNIRNRLPTPPKARNVHLRRHHWLFHQELAPQKFAQSCKTLWQSQIFEDGAGMCHHRQSVDYSSNLIKSNSSHGRSCLSQPRLFCDKWLWMLLSQPHC